MSTVFDQGLQPERTALAWRRTGLALLGGSLVAARILPETLGAWAAIPGLIGVAAAASLLYAIHRRYRQQHQRLTAEGDRSPIAGGRLVAAMAGFLLAAAIVSIVVTIALTARG
ncbi:DUF202 domain-containing protein [Leifsonia sp. 2MCAF36]|uniref:DUF202 domain-containing protein n=1 Tax=Leifsonia sp. 2MCAF36 TaxID=3232988 RepID=UPI003F952509